MFVWTMDPAMYAKPTKPKFSDLHKAAAEGNLEKVKKLASKLENKNPKNDDGMTPIHLAAFKGHLAIIKFLVPLVEDKNPKANRFSRYVGRTPLHCAAEEGRLDVIEYLCENIEGDTNPADERMATPFQLAAQQGHLHVVSFYTGRLPNPNPGRLSDDAFRGWTPLHNAAGNGHLPIVQHICSLLNDKNPKDAIGFTPLHNAAYRGHLEVVKYLIQFVEDWRSSRDTGFWGRKNPLEWAKEEGHWDIVNFFQHLDRPQSRSSEPMLRKKGSLAELLASKSNAQATRSAPPATPVTSTAPMTQPTPITPVTQGNDQEYDIDRVLQFLGVDDSSTKKPKRKPKKKRAQGQLQEPSNVEQSATPSTPIPPAASASSVTPVTSITQGNDQEYDIERVRQSLSVDDDSSKKKPKRKSKKKKTKKTQDQIQDASNVEKPTYDECTICFEPRNPTYLFFPCGHATFCKDCALRLSENEEKRCPDCRSTIQGTCRVFGTIGSK